MKKGHPFLAIIPLPNTTAKLKRGGKLEVEGNEEIIHSITSVEFEKDKVVFHGFLAKGEDTQ